MVAFPNCKINLGLHVTSKMADGYHNIETVFYPVGLKDVLEIVPAVTFNFALTGLPVNGDPSENLCVKAYNLLKNDFPHLPAVSIHLHKAIPMGAGLGGGSADGAFMLSMLNNQYKLGLAEEALMSYALLLGSDCPFFIRNKPCYATGRGENLSPVTLDLSAYKLALVNPSIHVSTREAFAHLIPLVRSKSILQIIQQPIETWAGELVNDFEYAVFKTHPELADIKETLYSAGAVYAAMTGSGSTLFALFDYTSELKFEFPTNYTSITVQE